MAKKKPKEVAITTTVEAIVAALGNSNIAKKTTIPILDYVRITNNVMIGTDLDLTTVIPFKAKGTGDFLVPHEQALNILKGESGPMTLQYNPENYQVKMVLGTLKFTLNGMSLANYPEIPKATKATLTIDGDIFKTMLARTVFVISNQESRYTMNGALLRVSGGNTVFVTTDGHRLSYTETEADGKIEDSVIARPALNWLKKNCSGPVLISVDDHTHTITTSTGTIFSRKLSGKFPEYNAIMPASMPIKAEFTSPAALSNTLKRVAKCADDRSRAVRLALGVNQVELSASSTENGSAKGKVDCITTGVDQHDFVMGLNATYLEEFLAAIGKEPFTASFKESQSAAMFEVPQFKYVVMPMRI